MRIVFLGFLVCASANYFHQSGLNSSKSQLRRGPFFWRRKVFEGVHSHVMNLLRKFDFGQLNFSSKFMITCPNPILVQFSIVRISDLVQIPILLRIWTEIDNSNHWKADENRIWTREEKLSGPKSNFRSKSITWEWTPSNTFLSQKREPRVW